MNVFTQGDAFSAGITSGLTVLSGISINVRTMLDKIGGNNRLEDIALKILKELRQAGQVGGVSLDDSLEDTVIRKTMRG